MDFERIMLSRVHLSGTEQKYINEAFADDWVVPLGPHVDEFEHRLERYLGVQSVVALSAGRLRFILASCSSA